MSIRIPTGDIRFFNQAQTDVEDKSNPPAHFVHRQLHLQTDVAASECSEFVEDNDRYPANIKSRPEALARSGRLFCSHLEPGMRGSRMRLTFFAEILNQESRSIRVLQVQGSPCILFDRQLSCRLPQRFWVEV